MSRDAKSLTSTLALFYAIGALLAVGAYALDSIDDLAIVLTFWLRQTLTFVVLAAGYGLYYVISGSAGHRPKAPLRFLDISFLAAAATLGVGMLVHS
ncbi:hypothetical protein ABIF38_000500 [Bradyrhizobium japonicum]|jgi:hypothetical protein|uniref:Uncharacterized protein n=1 Tax=Bradyrhizobium elkanii TaxID=29448 RepID=A0A4V1WEE0_BRAEL|nr:MULTISPECIES: hypothetical protein [Bradyrhizobium]MBP1290804.1 hypothetical protein [Bradyrhizobium elkanii]MBP2429346.1 hypothetical protein [Bradyrhizobium elkanii]MCP1737183.1 hypothetical protein [Bradyrhizobium elkanii]MCP1755229.1 hypothetical protein [Bradyrhizobium elkanii]MCP1928880.1 hypothetical protein [Bradyrhizobium elkanii]